METTSDITSGSSTEVGPSKWKSVKRHAHISFLSAISKMYGTSTSKNFRTPGPQPHVMVGPIIGKVTTTTARILVEIDAKGSLTLVIEENHATFEKQQSFLQRQLTPGRRELNQPVNPGRSHIKKLQKDVEANRPSVFEFRDLKPGTRYNVEVKGCRGSTNGSFCTFPVEPAETLTVGVISCNKIFITDLLIAPHSDLWTHLSKLVEAGKVDFLVHLGDQIYGDGDKRQDAEAGPDQDKWSDRFRLGKARLEGVPPEQWMVHQDAICERYREVYRDTWTHVPTAKCLANCSNFMIYDDHEVRDNWGDLTVDWDINSLEFFVARCAWIVSMEYQRQLYEDVDFSSVEKIQKDFHFHVVGGVGLLFLDIRGSRTFHRVKGDDKKYLGTFQWEAIKASLEPEGIFNEARALLVCSPAPLVFLEPRITQSAATAIHRLEDFKGHWSYGEHVKEQLMLIESLQKWKTSQTGREVLVLGGDVHCGGHSEIIKNHKVLFRQLTTSAIANMPLPKSAYYFMRAAGRVGRLQQDYCFRHHQWTRARNYGLVQIKNHSLEDHQDETIAHREVEISAQLVRGKFMSIPTYGEKVYNIDVNSSRWFSCCKA